MTELPSPEGLHPRALAHLGDAVYELWVREKAMATASHKLDVLHTYTTLRVQAAFQAKLLQELDPLLTEAEKDLVRRGRNVPVSAGRRSNQALHRQATAFEALVGHLHLSQPERLRELLTELAPLLETVDPKKI